MNTVERVPAQEGRSAVAGSSIGETLVAARQAQNLSVIDVANRLKLSVQQVEALEQGAYDRLPGAVFVRGFMRNYARLLKLDPEAMVRAVDAHLPRAAAEQSASSGETNIPMPAKSGSRWPLLAGGAAVVFLGAALVDVLWPEAPSNVGVVPEAGVASPSTVARSAPDTRAASSATAVSDMPAAQAPVTADAQTPAAPATATPVSPATAMTAGYQPDAAAAGTSLRLVFDQKSWVQIRDASGAVVLEALYPAGSSREITARPPLTLVIGNAPGVRLTYGNRAVDLAPHTRVAVARLTLE
ncbi:MAG: helix-turn-helix domain-containing protein [Rhodospirillaceae bacterium]